LKNLIKLIFLGLLLISCSNDKPNSDLLNKELDAYINQYKSINNSKHFLSKLFDEQPNSDRENKILGLYELAFENRSQYEGLISSIDKYSVYELLSYYEETFGDSKKYSKFQELILTQNDRNAGKQIEDFQFNDLNKEVHNLSEYNDKLIVIDFWATWCKPCLALEDDFKRIVKKYESDKNVKFISLAVRDSREKWLNHIEGQKKDYPNLLNGIFEDPINFDIPKGYFDLLTIPKFAFIDKGGITIYSNGPQPDVEYFEELIERNL